MLHLLLIAFALLCGLLMTRLMSRFRLPDVTAYLVAGVLIGPCCLGALGLGFTSFEQVEGMGLITDVALGFIAFAIGHEFRLSSLKKTGRQAIIIGILQAVIATLFVDAALIALHFLRPDLISIPAALTLGAIAAATAPAATLMVVRQYKAKGAVTDVLLPVVALDDVVGLVVFAISFGAAQAMTNGNTQLAVLLVQPLLEIVASLLLGGIVALILTFLERFFNSNRNRNALVIMAVLTAVAVAQCSFPIGRFTVAFSPLLVCMMLGTVFCNFCPLSEELMDIADKWSAPVLTLFFVLSGAELQLGVFANLAVVAVGVLYILFRSVGKILGARWSASLAKSDPMVRRYLGITLLPQAGVALGMCATAAKGLGADGAFVRNIVLFGVLIYEIVGPSLAKMALTKAGDIQAKSKDVLNRREAKLSAVTKPMPKRHHNR